MDKVLIIEIAAGVIGILVIAIETVIIFMLKKHMKSLDRHLDHLDEHSHKLEEQMERMFARVCGNNSDEEIKD